MFEKYVESPVDCKIFLKYESSTGKEIKEILLTQALSYRITENKKPVYGFNRNRFSQVIKGKRLIEGVIVLKKSIFNEIGDLISLALDEKDQERVELTAQKIAYLNTAINDNTLKSLVSEYAKEASIYYQNQIDQLSKSQKYNIFNTMPEGTQLIVAFGSLVNSNEFKQEYTNIIKKGENNYGAELEKLIKRDSELVIEDINFTEKTGEINISKSDVDEVYKFFGSLDGWLE